MDFKFLFTLWTAQWMINSATSILRTSTQCTNIFLGYTYFNSWKWVLSWEIGQTTRLLFSQFSWDLNFSVQILDSQILSSWLLSKLRIKSRCFQISKETVNLQFPGTQTTFHNEFTEKSNSVVNIRNIRVRLQEMVAQGGLTVNLFSRKRRLMSTLYSVLLCLEP